MIATPALVSVIMGSQSDWPTLIHCAEMLEKLEIPYEKQILSAHRAPRRLFEYAGSLQQSSVKVIIGAAGGAAHLPGMIAALTPLPVLGVPMESQALGGLDSLLSIVQMPGGVPVGTLAIGKAGATNAALLAAAILALSEPTIAANLSAFRTAQNNTIAPEPGAAKSS